MPETESGSLANGIERRRHSLQHRGQALVREFVEDAFELLAFLLVQRRQQLALAAQRERYDLVVDLVARFAGVRCSR